MSKDIRAKEISIRIRDIREKLKLSQKEMATRVNISGPTLSEFENGKLYPNFEYIYNINRKFKVNLYYLLFGEGEMYDAPEGMLADRLEKLSRENKEAYVMLDYIEKSSIIRNDLLSHFMSKLLDEKSSIEREINEKIPPRK